MKLLCLETCWDDAYYTEEQVYTVDAEKGKRLLATGYFKVLDGPPPEKPVDEQPPGRRKKITVK